MNGLIEDFYFLVELRLGTLGILIEIIENEAQDQK